MIRSMTGFGLAERTAGGFSLRVELKSVNHRYLELAVRLPREWFMLEDGVKRTLQQQLKRGRIDVFVTIESDRAGGKAANIDWALAEAFVSAAEQLKARFRLEGTLALTDLLAVPDLIKVKDSDSSDALEAELLDCVRDAAASLVLMRGREGLHLFADLRERLAVLERLRSAVASTTEAVVDDYRRRLAERISELLGDVPVDENRLATEVALFADRADITEELTRLASHFSQFEQLLQAEEPIGRKLDFLIQEMNREANTIGAKAGHVKLAGAVVNMKAELEKMREQVQNIE